MEILVIGCLIGIALCAVGFIWSVFFQPPEEYTEEELKLKLIMLRIENKYDPVPRKIVIQEIHR